MIGGWPAAGPEKTVSDMSRALVLAAVVLALACQKPRDVVTARQLLQAHRDGERVVLSGVARNPRMQSPAGANTYTSFEVVDGTGHVPVIAWGTQDVASNDFVEVRGTFHQRMAVGQDVLRDVVEAKFVRPLRKAPQPPGTPVSPP